MPWLRPGNLELEPTRGALRDHQTCPAGASRASKEERHVREKTYFNRDRDAKRNQKRPADITKDELVYCNKGGDQPGNQDDNKTSASSPGCKGPDFWQFPIGRQMAVSHCDSFLLVSSHAGQLQVA